MCVYSTGSVCVRMCVYIILYIVAANHSATTILGGVNKWFLLNCFPIYNNVRLLFNLLFDAAYNL